MFIIYICNGFHYVTLNQFEIVLSSFFFRNNTIDYNHIDRAERNRGKTKLYGRHNLLFWDHITLKVGSIKTRHKEQGPGNRWIRLAFGRVEYCSAGDDYRELELFLVRFDWFPPWESPLQIDLNMWVYAFEEKWWFRCKVIRICFGLLFKVCSSWFVCVKDTHIFCSIFIQKKTLDRIKL